MLRTAFAAVALLSIGTVSLGVDKAAGPANPAAPSAATDETAKLSTAELAKLIEQLDDADFEVRKTATAKLASAGPEAGEALVKAIRNASPETVGRIVSVFSQWHASGDAARKEVATKHLKDLAAGTNPVAARRAKAVLAPPPAAGQDPNGVIFGNVVIQAAAVGGGTKVQTRVVNGVTEITAEEKDSTVKITHENSKKIRMSITEPAKEGEKEGKKRDVEADDLDDLKKKDPEAAKLFEKYNRNVAIGGLRVIGGRAIARPLPAILPPVADERPNTTPEQQAALKELRGQQEKLAATVTKLQDLTAKGPASPEALKPILDELRSIQETMTKLSKSLAN